MYVSLMALNMMYLGIFTSLADEEASDVTIQKMLGNDMVGQYVTQRQYVAQRHVAAKRA